MRPPLTLGLVRSLTRRLCALPEKHGELFARDEGSAEFERIERALRRFARTDQHAERMTEVIEREGVRPDNAALELAAMDEMPPEWTGVLPPGKEDMPGRSLCTVCRGARTVEQWRLVWTELDEAGRPRKRARKVASREQGFEELDRLGPDTHNADVYSVALDCGCVKETTVK